MRPPLRQNPPRCESPGHTDIHQESENMIGLYITCGYNEHIIIAMLYGDHTVIKGMMMITMPIKPTLSQTLKKITKFTEILTVVLNFKLNS